MPDEETPKPLTVGSWLSIGSPHVAEMMIRTGFDWLVIDMEHSAANSLTRVDGLIQVIDLGGCVPLVRVPANDATIIKQVMDAGSHGVVVPMVNSRSEAEAAVGAVRYPPTGSRGVGLWRAQGYGRTFESYKSWLEHDSRVIVQIEHIRAVENLKEIISVDGVDGFIIGPYDLSASLGRPGEFDHPAVLDALAEVEKTACETGKWAGYHIVFPDREQFLDRVRRGYNFIAYGVDFTFLTSSLDREMSLLQEALPGSGRSDRKGWSPRESRK